jgi:hypothetical protein
MRRVREPTGSRLDQERAERDAAVMRLNELLSDKYEREKLGVVPKVNFGRLVRANRAHMHWIHPENVFEAAGVEPVRMNTGQVRAFLAEVGERSEAEAALYEELFVTHIRFVPWAEFCDRFARVVREVVAAVAQQREETQPRRLTLLALRSDGVAKSNAWLVGFAWPWLASVVDYVVNGWRAVDNLVKALADPAYAIDVIFVDDMIYSGNQAHDILFDPKMKSAARTHIYIAAPFMATAGAQFLARAAQVRGVGALHVPRTLTIVPSYRSLITTRPLEDALDRLPEGLKAMLRIIRHPELNPFHELTTLPAIVFEHKLADGISVPEFLIEADFYGIGLPKLVLDPMRPFYKSGKMKWHMYGHDDGKVVRDFSTIDAHLFAALLAAPYAHSSC